MRRSLQILALVLTSLHAPLAAQGSTADPVTPPRVRVRQVGLERPVIGTLTHLGPDTLYLQSADGDLAILRSDVTRIDVSRGIHSNADRGFKIGLMAGAAVGLAAGLAMVSDPEGCLCDTGAGAVPLAMAIVALPSALVGAGIGALSRSEQWRKTRLGDHALSLRVVPRKGRLAVELGMGMNF